MVRGNGCAFEKVVRMERLVQREGQARQVISVLLQRL